MDQHALARSHEICTTQAERGHRRNGGCLLGGGAATHTRTLPAERGAPDRLLPGPPIDGGSAAPPKRRPAASDAASDDAPGRAELGPEPDPGVPLEWEWVPLLDEPICREKVPADEDEEEAKCSATTGTTVLEPGTRMGLGPPTVPYRPGVFVPLLLPPEREALVDRP